MTSSIPTIDFGKFSNGSQEDKKEVANKWYTALKHYGFVHLINHPMAPETRKNLYNDLKSFFNLENEIKMKYCFGEGYGMAGGYTPVGVEKVSKSTGDVTAPPDVVENLVFRSIGKNPINAPSEPDLESLQESVKKYAKSIREVYSCLAELTVTALDTDDEEEKLINDFFFNQPELDLRFAFYPGKEFEKEKNSGKTPSLYGAHTDYTGFTLLAQDDVGGLEVLIKNDFSNHNHVTNCPNNRGQNTTKYSNDCANCCCTWTPIIPLANAFVINAGDVIQRWSNDHWLSNTHRVVPLKNGKEQKDRLSMVCFTGPCYENVVSVLPSFCTTEQPKRYEPISAYDHLIQKLDKSNA